MKNLPLPQHINMLRLSEHAANFHGSLLIKDLSRLAPSLYSDEGEVDVNLSFAADEEGTRYCRLQLKTAVKLQCQRCMEAFTYEVASDFLQGVVGSEKEAESLSDRYEPVIVQDGLLIVQDMVEDELILKMPIVPMHVEGQCQLKVTALDPTWSEADEGKKNPFHVLKELKQKTKSEG